VTREKAVVIGGSLGGLLAARALADGQRRIVIVERDEFADDTLPRQHVPQGHHAHALLAAGAESLSRMFPGIIEELLTAGAVRASIADGIWHHGGALRVRYQSRIDPMGFSRPLLERAVRRRVVALPGVSVATGVTVSGLTGDAGRISGVVLQRGGRRETVGADLVVDCTGRAARSLDWLAEMGHELPDVSEVRADLGYSTVIVPRRPGDLGGADFLVALQPPSGLRGAFVVPIEARRWIVSLTGWHGDHPGSDYANVLEFARSLPVPEVAELLERHGPMRPRTHRMLSSQWRHVERLRRPPSGHLLLGDSICSFNPIYGQGMSSAALQADALAMAVRRHGLAGERLARVFYRRAARIVSAAWAIAVTSDFALPQTTGPKPVGADLVNRFMIQVLRACHVSPEIAEQMYRVQNLQASPVSLMRPDRVVRTLLAARRSPAVRGVAPEAETPLVDSAVTA
jgi:2-polyprenyl-6-methoxyphenol hydroxylase-like FAD-dependent oxidoreductase